MINTTNPAQFQQFQASLFAHADAPATVLSPLKSLLGSGSFTGKSIAQQVSLLNARAVVASPPQGTVTISAMPINRFAAILSDLLAAVSALPDSNPHKSQIMAAYQVQQGPLSIATTVDFSGSAMQGLLALVVGSGAVTQAQVQAFSTQPDPAWKPQTIQPSPFETIAGTGILAEADDIRQALAYNAPASGS